jgi:predicted unusual protein kinase regulating ubiquinone biosynthesis (AarF/ABC1/UbiB family)
MPPKRETPAPQDHIPQSKLARGGAFLKTGARVGGTYLAGAVKRGLGAKTSDEALQERVATQLLQGLTKLRGTALKIAQVMSLDDSVLPPAMQRVLAQAQHSVPPMSGPLVVKVFTSTVGQPPGKVFQRFNTEATRAASLGQVHEAWLEGRRLAVKIQYPGVAATIQSDIKMAKQLARVAVSSMPRSVANFSAQELEPYFAEVEARLMEETDYALELQNSQAFAQQCQGLPGVVFPEYFPHLSGDRVLTMEWLEGLHIDDFLATQPSAELRRTAAQHLWNYYEHQLHRLHRLNTDTHPGNFLFRPDGTVAVLDFGCVKTVPPHIYHALNEMMQPGCYDDPTRLEPVLRDTDILRPTDPPATVAHITALFGNMLRAMGEPYARGRFNFNNPEWQQRVLETGMELKQLKEVRGSKDLIFVNRTYYGLYAILRRLDVEIDTPPFQA